MKSQHSTTSITKIGIFCLTLKRELMVNGTKWGLENEAEAAANEEARREDVCIV